MCVFGNDQCFHFQGNLLFQRDFADRKEKEIKCQGNGHPIWGIPSRAHIDFTCFSLYVHSFRYLVVRYAVLCLN